MDDLVQWLGKQLDEDERIARGATWCDEAASWHTEPSLYGARDKGQRWYVEDAMDDGVISHVDPAASDDEGVARHIAEHDPARVLREIDANRRRLERHAPRPQVGRDSDENDPSTYVLGCSTCQVGVVSEGDWPCEEVRDMLVSYADRPGYLKEWRP